MRSGNPLQIWNLVLVLSGLAIVGTAVYDFVTPPIKFELSGKARAEQQGRIRAQSFNLREEIDLVQARIYGRLWKEDPELIGPTALKSVMKFATAHNIKVGSFRPQKPVVEGKLSRIPFVVSLEGTYTEVLRFVRDLEAPSNKLVVNLVQISSADGASSVVNATVGLWAMQESKQEEKPAARRRGNV